MGSLPRVSDNFSENLRSKTILFRGLIESSLQCSEIVAHFGPLPRKNGSFSVNGARRSSCWEPAQLIVVGIIGVRLPQISRTNAERLDSSLGNLCKTHRQWP